MSGRSYRFGFLCLPPTFRPVEVVKDWTRIQVPGRTVLVHPETSHHMITDAADRTVLAIGDIFVAHGRRELEQSMLDVASGDHSVFDDLSGRFALFIFDDKRPSVINDPLGSQAVFYSGGEHVLVASHSALIAEVLGCLKSSLIKRYMASEEYRARTTRFLPGDLTLYDGVHLLIPNNELSLTTGQTRRYWPRSSTVKSDYAEILELWDEYFSAYAKFLSPRYRPVVGLTGGVDSRSIIATLRSKQLEMRYETWDKMPMDEANRIPGIVAHLGGEHRWIDMSRRSDDPEFLAIREAAKGAAGFTRGTPLLPAQMAEGAGNRDLFIYGHGSGVFGGVFSRKRKTWLPEDPVKLAYTLYAGDVRHNAGPEYRKFTMQAIEGFFARGNYAAGVHDADIGDLIYWESRMGNWASQQLAAVSVGLQAHAALNSRRLFQAFWGAEIEARTDKKFQRSIMKHYDPTLAEL